MIFKLKRNSPIKEIFSKIFDDKKLFERKRIRLSLNNKEPNSKANVEPIKVFKVSKIIISYFISFMSGGSGMLRHKFLIAFLNFCKVAF